MVGWFVYVYTARWFVGLRLYCQVVSLSTSILVAVSNLWLHTFSWLFYLSLAVFCVFICRNKLYNVVFVNDETSTILHNAFC